MHTDVDPTPMRLCPYRLVKNVWGRTKIRFTPFLGCFDKNLEKAVFLAWKQIMFSEPTCIRVCLEAKWSFCLFISFEITLPLSDPILKLIRTFWSTSGAFTSTLSGPLLSLPLYWRQSTRFANLALLTFRSTPIPLLLKPTS